MRTCSGIRADGERCRGIAKGNSDFCPAHDPARAEARKRTASKAAKSKAMPEITEIEKRIRDLAEQVVSGKVDRGKASVAFQGFGVLKGFIELRRKVKEQEELEARLDALEEAAERVSQNRGKQWGT